MASSEELKEVLKETLENQGVLGQIRARIRAEVFNALDDQTEPRPTLTNENMLINELIREYLDFNKYKYTQSVFLTETGQPKDPIDRNFLSQELNISEDHATASTPLLYGMMTHFLQRPNKERAPANRRPINDQRTSSRDSCDRSDTSDFREPGAFTLRAGRR